MAGLATRLLAARRVAVELKSMAAPESRIIEENESWYYFGALGPALGDFIPSQIPEAFGEPGRTPYYSVWVEILKIAVGDAKEGLPGVAPTVRTLREVVDATRRAVLAQDESALLDLRDLGKLDAVIQASKDLGVILRYFGDVARLVELGNLTGVFSRPKINDSNQVVLEQLWSGRDWLHWKRTGKFATTLLEKARAGAPHLQAYALGWQVAFATLLCSSGFINSAVGSTYRTHWWRHRWVCNFIDTWLWGFYDENGKDRGADPEGPFQNWRSLCDAGLHEWIDVTGGALDVEEAATAMAADSSMPEALPEDFISFWLDSWAEAYGSVTPPVFTAKGLQVAYAALSVVLWFQTSGFVIGCNPEPGPPPSACGGDPEPPDWIDPTQTNPITGQPFQPPVPQPGNAPNNSEIVSGALLALLGVAMIVSGGAVVGIALVAEGVDLIVDGAIEPNWKRLECDLYWIDVYLHNGLTALHGVTVLGGVQHPYPADLDVDQLVLQFQGYEFPYTSGAAVVRSRSLEGLRQPWSGLISTWTSYPTEPYEGPPTDVWNLGGLRWPNIFFDDLTQNPVTEDLASPPAAWPGGVSGNFGPAVQNALALILQPSSPPPNWNLDGDRGRGWLTWRLDQPYASPLDPVPET